MKLKQTLDRMNWSFGRGDLTSVQIDEDGKAGIVCRSIPTSQNNRHHESRRFTLDGNKVRFLGKTRTIGYKVR